jgi:hypothetical protein
MDEKLESNRKLCLKQQTELRRVLTRSKQHDEAMQLFFSQHALLHSANMAGTEPWSFEDAILDDMDEKHIRCIPQNCEHSVAWNIWHIARIEDVAMNLLVAGSPQIFYQDNWLERMRVKVHHTGNAMHPDGVADLSAKIDIGELRAYRLAVGRGTRKIVEKLEPADLVRKVDPACLRRVSDEGAVVEAAQGIIDYWGKRNVAGLLLMPATRHCLVHLNESLQLKRRRR